MSIVTTDDTSNRECTAGQLKNIYFMQVPAEVPCLSGGVVNI